jgi:mono/diheme cytochrome c family protein
MRQAFFAAGLLWLSAASLAGAETPPAARPPLASMSAGDARALVDRYCVSCHNQRTKAADLLLDRAHLDRVAEDADAWEKVVKKLKTGAMPPAGSPRPETATLNTFVTWLESTLDREAASAPNPGRPAVHRLNRTEYTNAIRDLLGLTIDGSAFLPADTTGFGFDNVADILSVSPGLLDRYMTAAHKLSRMALGDPAIKPGLQVYQIPYMVLQQDSRMSVEMPFGSRGGTSIRHMFPVDGEYSIRVILQRSYLATEPRGLPTREDVDVRLDGERVAWLPIGGPGSTGVNPYESAPGEDADKHLAVRVRTTAGLHTIAVSFQNRNWKSEGVGPSRYPPASYATQNAKGTSVVNGRAEMGVDQIHVEGPFGGTRPMASESRKRLMVCAPRSAANEAGCARTILFTLARRAYRRPVSGAEVSGLMELYTSARADGADFDGGIQLALERVLVSPYFIFRTERDPVKAQPGAAYRISDVELASRLSFFLWSSIPDDRLLDLAIAGRLKDPVTREGEVRRMLADPRSKAFTENFFGQWLYLRNAKLHRPDPKAFMDFDENLREAFITETLMFTDSQVREDRGVLELLTANYTFANERLARHYGITGVYGPRFRRVTLPDARRAGILGQGSLLTVTSMSTRTSPVKRGAWLLEHLLGTPPPPPPANVPPLPESKDGQRIPASMRERMEQHRRNPVCASCHSKMDPLGFALENFDGIGQWRDRDGTALIDPSGTLPDGSKFAEPAGFKQALLTRPEPLVSNVITKLMTYALGRGVEAYDMPAVRKIRRDAAAGGYRWSSLILGVVESMPFQMRRAS